MTADGISKMAQFFFLNKQQNKTKKTGPLGCFIFSCCSRNGANNSQTPSSPKWLLSRRRMQHVSCSLSCTAVSSGHNNRPSRLPRSVNCVHSALFFLLLEKTNIALSISKANLFNDRTDGCMHIIICLWFVMDDDALD